MNYQSNSKASKADLLFQKAFAAHNLGQLEEAEDLYLRVLRETPKDMETLYLLGTACSQLGKFDEAVKYLSKALEIAPNHPEALNNMGLTLKGQRKDEEAVAFYERALAQKPDYVDAHNNLGNALEKLGRLEESEMHLRRALDLHPDSANAWCNLGLVLKAKDRFEEAVQCFLRGIELRGDAEIKNTEIVYDDIGQIYKVWGRLETALMWFDRAIACKPDAYSAHNNRGAALEELGRLDEALLAYQRASELEPEITTPRWNQAFLFLRQGILDRGWEAHELRMLGGQVVDRFHDYPLWDGSSLAGKTILLYAEQGLGDEICFASCFPEMIAEAKHCIIECEPRLGPLFARSFPTATVVGVLRSDQSWLDKVPPIDVKMIAGGLPRYLRPTLDHFPKTPAYLSADPQQVTYWRERLASLGPGKKIGICWRSGMTKGERHKFYSDLTQWGNILTIAGTHIINLQYGDCVDELREAELKFGIRIISFPELDLRNAIDDSAALMAALDFVVSAATAVSEIAGAIGVESYRLNHFGKQWEVLGATEFMPWHPSVKLVDQQMQGDWDTQLALLAEDIKERIAGKASAIEFVTLSNQSEIALVSSLEDSHTYILKEQHAWFEAEYGFVFDLAQSAAHIIDLGAGVGEYAVPMAKQLASSGGRVWAVAQTPAATAMLMRSRSRNHLESSLDVSIMHEAFSLDAAMDKHGLDDISLVRISSQVNAEALIKQGERFFSANSPLVMFAVQPGALFNSSIVTWLRTHHFELYRLIPGLNVLVSFVAPNELDAFSLNLFACKLDRAQSLERQGLLIRQPITLNQLPSFDQSLWQKYLETMPYVKGLMSRWCIPHSGAPDWEVYWMALNLFAMAKDSNASAAERFAYLQMAINVMTTLIQTQANFPRLLSLCRMLIEVGRREVALDLLNQVCALIHKGMSCELIEPCLALDQAFSQKQPGEKQGDWSVAMVLEKREQLRSFSNYFTGAESLATLKEIFALGFGSDELARRIALIEQRFGL